MNTRLRRILLGVTVAIGLYVGIWAAFLPDAFYHSFPGFGRHWIDMDGPYNQHLIQDVGFLYLGLCAASVAAMLSRDAAPGRVAGLAWALFGVLHFGYHVLHLPDSAVDVTGTVVSLGVSAGIGIVLLLPSRAAGHAGRVAR